MGKERDWELTVLKGSNSECQDWPNIMGSFPRSRGLLYYLIPPINIQYPSPGGERSMIYI